MLHRHVLNRVAWCVAIGTAAVGCGGKDAGTVDATPSGDAPSGDAPIGDAPGSDAPGPTEITIKTFPEKLPSYNGRTEDAELVAFQDGDGPWTALTGTGGVYHATVTGLRYGVAVGCTVEFDSGIRLYYQSVSDTREVLADGCSSNVASVHVSVDLQGLQTGQRGEVWLGSAVGFEASGRAAEIDVAKGTADLFARSSVFDNGTGSRVPVKLYRGPTLDLQVDQSLKVDLDAVGRPPESHALSLTGLQPPESASQTVQVHSSYATPNSQLQWPLATQNFGTMTPDSYVTIDAALRQPADISNVTVLALGTTTDGRTYERYVRFAMKTPGAPSLALPVIWTATAPTVDHAAVPRAIVTLPITPPTLGLSEYHASLSTNDANMLPHTLTMFVKPGWAGGQPSVTITAPDLSGLSGWSAKMALVPDAAVNWTLEWDDRNQPYEALPVDGRHIHGSIIQGQIPATLP